MVNRRNVNASKRRAAGSFARQFFVGFLLFLLLLLVGGVVWYGSRLETLTIVNVNVAGGDTIDHAAIKAAVEQELEGSYYRLVPRRFSWTYPEDKVRAAVLKVEKVREARITRPDNRTIDVFVYEYQPEAMWCKSKDSLVQCVFLDEQGYAFARAPILSGTAMLRLYDGQEPTVGLKPFTYEFVRATTKLAEALRQRLGMSVTVAERIGVDEVTFEVAGGGQIKTTLKQSVDDSLSNLEVLLSSPDFDHLAPGNFQYIDLRFGDKVFVNEEVEGETATTTEEASE